MKISFVIPCYRSEKTVAGVVSELKQSVRPADTYEIICVNDCSPDNTIGVLRDIADQDERVKVIDLAKNSGQHNALMAGYRHVSGEVVVTLEDDGQSPPSEFYHLIESLDNEHDVVYAGFGTKKQGAFRNLGSWFAGVMGQAMMGAPKDIEGSSFFAAKRFVIDEVVRYGNPYTFIHGLILRTTSKLGNYPIEHRARMEGSSGYTFKKLVSLWLNGFTSFSVKPLRLASALGFIVALIGFIFGVVVVARKLVFPEIAAGYSSLMAVILLVGGLIMVLLGMLGEYVGRIYISMNNAPQYVVRATYNVLDEKER